MAAIRVRGNNVDVDVRAELEKFPWDRARWTGDKLIACSPFRNGSDRNPSFFVNLEGDFAGTWKDSGSIDHDYGSGGFVRLLSFLRAETYEETEEYLLSEYGISWQGEALVKIPKLNLAEKKDLHLDEAVLDRYRFRHQYLTRRGISENVQRLMKIGYDVDSKAVTIPWFSPDGRLANIKKRRIDSKVFWYDKGVPIKTLVYGMDVVYKIKAHEVILTESETDSLTWMTVGKPSIAVAGANLSDYQADLIKRSYIEKLIICADNDEAGQKLKEKVIGKLRGHIELANINLPKQWKDANEAHLNTNILEFYEEIVPIRQIKSLNVERFVGN